MSFIDRLSDRVGGGHPCTSWSAAWPDWGRELLRWQWDFRHAQERSSRSGCPWEPGPRLFVPNRDLRKSPGRIEKDKAIPAGVPRRRPEGQRSSKFAGAQNNCREVHAWQRNSACSDHRERRHEVNCTESTSYTRG